VIGAIHGVAFGGGLQIMLGADIRYITADTKLSIMETKWGIIPDMAGTQIMRHLIREDIIKELTYTHRVFSGTEAVQYGFATHVVEDPHTAAMTLAKEIASKSPDAIVTAKRVINAAPYLNQEEGLLLESKAQQGILLKENQLEAVFSGMQKRAGKFKDFGFAFLPAYEKNGYAYEAAKKLRDEGFASFGIHTISAITLPSNLDSQKLLKKLGLTFVKMIQLPNEDEKLMLYQINRF